jgi:hypothetical protein
MPGRHKKRGPLPLMAPVYHHLTLRTTHCSPIRHILVAKARARSVLARHLLLTSLQLLTSPLPPNPWLMLPLRSWLPL